MLQAAIDGLGVALSENALAGDDLAAGRLRAALRHHAVDRLRLLRRDARGLGRSSEDRGLSRLAEDEACGKDPEAPVVGAPGA